MAKCNGLDLFSGVGGISIGLSEWVTPIAYCESDRYCQGVLLSRMANGEIAQAPIWDDVRTLEGHVFRQAIDIIYGGFPCQDISCAGAGAGLGGERSGLFFEIIRLTGELRPKFVFLENVPAITVRGLDRILLEFAALGYDARWTTISAASVGANHIRERWFLLAHAAGITERESSNETNAIATCRQAWNEFVDGCKYVGDAASAISKRHRPVKSKKQNGPTDASWWATEPNVGRVADGVPHRVDRIRALGNAAVPLQARTAFKRLCGLK